MFLISFCNPHMAKLNINSIDTDTIYLHDVPQIHIKTEPTEIQHKIEEKSRLRKKANAKSLYRDSLHHPSHFRNVYFYF